MLARRRIMLVNEESDQLGDSYYRYDLVKETAIAQLQPVEEGVFVHVGQICQRRID